MGFDLARAQAGSFGRAELPAGPDPRPPVMGTACTIACMKALKKRAEEEAALERAN